MYELLAAPAEKFFDPSERIYWGYLLSALVIASAAISYQERRFKPLNQLRRLLNASYWFNKSTLYDVVLMVVNTIMRLTLLIPLFGSHVAVTVLVGGFLQDNFGDAPSIEFSWIWIAIAFSFSYVILDDLSRFLLHYCMHNVEFLWYFHKTHHSATTLTPLTIFRVHPVESILYFVRRLVVFGFVTGVFIWLFSSKLTGLQILGVDMFGFLFNLAAANLRHSHIWISFGKLEKIFISPAQHQIHHSVGSNHFNMGSIFSFWDRLAGTFLLSGEKRELTFGIQSDDRRIKQTKSEANSENGTVEQYS